MKTFLLLLLSIMLCAAQSPFIGTRTSTLNQRGVYQVRNITNGVAFPLLTLAVPSNSCASINIDFSAESSQATARAIQAGAYRTVAINVNGVIMTEQQTYGVLELDTGGSLVMTMGAIKTPTNLVITVTLTDSTRTNCVFNYRVVNLDTNFVSQFNGLQLPL